MNKEEFNSDEWQGRTWEKVVDNEKLGFYTALVFVAAIVIISILSFINK